jgi:hypothetical protein
MPDACRPYPSDLSDEEWAVLELLLASPARRNSTLFRTSIDRSPQHVYTKDTESRYVLNQIVHVRSFLGTASPEVIVGKTDLYFYPKELAKRYRADEQEVIRSGQPLVGKEELGQDGEGNRRRRRRRRWWCRPPRFSFRTTASRSWGS